MPGEQAAWAAVLATGGRLTGAHVLGLRGLEGGGCGEAPAVVVPAGSEAPREVAVVLIETDLPPQLCGTVNGIPCVAVEVAVIHLARGAPLRRVQQAVDSARWAGCLRIEGLLETAHLFGSDLGAAKVKWMAEAGLFEDESHGERTLDRCLGTLGLLFAKQVADIVPGRRFDRYCDPARLALEYDGRIGDRDLDRDASKDLEAAAAGVLVLHITKGMLRPGRVRGTVARIAALVLQRTAARAERPAA